MSLEDLRARVAFCQSQTSQPALEAAKSALKAEEIRAPYFAPMTLEDLTGRLIIYAQNVYGVYLNREYDTVISSPRSEASTNKIAVFSNLLWNLGIENNYSTHPSLYDDQNQDIRIQELTIPTNQDFFYGRARLMISTLARSAANYSQPLVRDRVSINDAFDAATMSWGLPRNDRAINYVGKINSLNAGRKFTCSPD